MQPSRRLNGPRGHCGFRPDFHGRRGGNPAKENVMTTEEPHYTVLTSDADFEIRQYAPYIIKDRPFGP